MHPYFQGSTIHNSQDRETTKLSIDRKVKMLYRYAMEYYSVPGGGGACGARMWVPGPLTSG